MNRPLRIISTTKILSRIHAGKNRLLSLEKDMRKMSPPNEAALRDVIAARHLLESAGAKFSDSSSART